MIFPVRGILTPLRIIHSSQLDRNTIGTSIYISLMMPSHDHVSCDWTDENTTNTTFDGEAWRASPDHVPSCAAPKYPKTNAYYGKVEVGDFKLRPHLPRIYMQLLTD